MKLGRLVMGCLYVGAGLLHFVKTPLYMSIMPPYLPSHRALVLISGVAEMAGGAGILMPIPVVRRSAAWGIVALLAAVSPANFYMAMHPAAFPRVPVWALWARLPLQLPLMYWAWLYSRQQCSNIAT